MIGLQYLRSCSVEDKQCFNHSAYKTLLPPPSVRRRRIHGKWIVICGIDLCCLASSLTCTTSTRDAPQDVSKRTLQPMVTSTSVLAMKFRGGGRDRGRAEDHSNFHFGLKL